VVPFLIAFLVAAAPTTIQKGLMTYEGREARVKSNASPEVSKLALARIDRYCDVFQKFFDGLNLEKRADNKIVARLFRTFDEYAEFRNRDVGEKPWAAYFSASLNAIVLYDDAADTSLKHTLFHECQHQYLARYTTSAPRWLNEGLAEYFEGWRVPDEGALEPRPVLYDLIVLQGALKRNQAIPLQTLMNLPSDDFIDFAKKFPDKHPSLHYATSWGIVYYFLALAPEGDRPSLRAYLGALNQKGAKGDRARLELDWTTFEDRWKRAILALEPACDSVEDFLDVAAGYRSDSQWKEACEAYASAIKKDGNRKGLRYWLGYCRKRTGDYSAATKSLEEARAEDGKDPRPSYLLARIASGLDQQRAKVDAPRALELAREALKRAGGEDPHYMAFVARCQALNGDTREAIATMTRVMALVDKDDRASYESMLQEIKKSEKR
jgi:tetratricopeptide (TPR) repeat protein